MAIRLPNSYNIGAKIPPSGGESPWGRIVSGSYDETIIIWKKMLVLRLRHSITSLQKNSTEELSHEERLFRNHLRKYFSSSYAVSILTFGPPQRTEIVLKLSIRFIQQIQKNI